jgi:glutathione S-transferase
MKLYFHPISSSSQKVTIAMSEKEVNFTPEIVNIMEPAAKQELKKINPNGKVPILVLDDGWKIPESTIIIEYLDSYYPQQGTRLIPADRDLARRARFMDRVADLYLNEPMLTILFDGMKPEADREPKRVAASRERLDINLPLLDAQLSKTNKWALGDSFTLADCSLAPCLFYLRNIHPYAQFKNIEAYWSRLSERPSVKKAIGDALPYLQKMGAGK